MQPTPSSSTSPGRRRHRKRSSVSGLSSDTTTSLPPYKPLTILPTILPESYDKPPDYPDSAEEADEETDEQEQQQQVLRYSGASAHLLSPPLSPRPRRRKIFRANSSFQRRTNFYDNQQTQSDLFLDRILERSVAALEISNALLQTSMSNQSSLSVIISSDHNNSVTSLDRQPQTPLECNNTKTCSGSNNHSDTRERWMDELNDLARDVEALYDSMPGPSSGRLTVPNRTGGFEGDESAVSRSFPTTGVKVPPRCSTESRRRGNSDSGRLRLSTGHSDSYHSPPPRAMTQFVNVGAEFNGQCHGDMHDTSSDMSLSSILLPSTLGLRSSSRLSEFNSLSGSTTFSPPPPSPSAYESLARHAGRSPASSRSPSASRSSSITYRPRSRSRSSNQPSSPHLLPRIIPPPIEELPSQSESSSSESPHPFRTLESLRKILDDEQRMAPDRKGKRTENRSPTRLLSPAFLPRTPPVGPVTSTSTTTTSISRLFTKGSHSTSTRARTPPRQSSLKNRPPSIQTNSSRSSFADILSPMSVVPSAPSSGRSTPRNVAFGPLPEPLRPEGAPSKFREHKEAKAKAKRSRGRHGEPGSGLKLKSGEKEESSWWMTWLTGGSGLSMSAARQEERFEDRMARSWGRPGFMGEEMPWAV